MKFLSSILILCLSISSFSQNSKVNGRKNLLDANGFPKSQQKQDSRGTDFSPRSTDDIVLGYEDTRALSEINTAGVGDAYPWISSDGLRLYYTNGLDVNNLLLYYSERANVDSPFQTPTLAPINIVAPLSIWLSENEMEAYATTFDSFGNKLYFYQRNSLEQPFGTPQEIILNGITLGFISGASLNASQTELILYSTDYGVITFNRTSSNSFDFVGTLLTPTSSTTPGQISKDDLTFFFGISNIELDIAINQLERSTVADAFSSSTLQEISDLNEPLYSSVQPSMSSELEWVVFVRSLGNSWENNDLYISRKAALSVIKNETKNSYTVIPNPTTGKFTISLATTLNSNEYYTISIYDSTGKLLFEKPMASEIDLTDYASGIYFAKIAGGTFFEVQKIIRN